MLFGGYDPDFQQIQGSQQIGILEQTTFGRRNSWSTGAIDGFYFILDELNLLASLNLLENMCLPHHPHAEAFPPQAKSSQ
jgi:hypothetical protein